MTNADRFAVVVACTVVGALLAILISYVNRPVTGIVSPAVVSEVCAPMDGPLGRQGLRDRILAGCY